MSAWVHWSWVKAEPKPIDRDPRFYGRVAPHIRGRVFRVTPGYKRRRALWGMEVVNTHTGKVLASDNCTHLPSLIAECDEATACARAAWFWSFKPKDLR